MKSWPTSLVRPAPRANRMANSRFRLTPRARSRFARFVQARRRTSPATAMRNTATFASPASIPGSMAWP